MHPDAMFFDLPFPDEPRWFPGDQYLRTPVRKLLAPFRGRGPSGLGKVTKNLRLGLDKLKAPYVLEQRLQPSSKLDTVFGILHGPLEASRTLARLGSCIVGPGILNNPSEWPDLFTDTQAVYNIQNCEWAAAMYRPIYGERVKIWRMGIDHERYAPSANQEKIYDILIYDKIRWPETPAYHGLLEFCCEALRKAGVKTHYIRYGKYPKGRETAYHDMLRQSRAMLFLSENETQGFAYNEALSLDVPILAWNFGKWCDPNRFKFGLDDVAATSIPYWDERCGMDFHGMDDFVSQLGRFLERMRGGCFSPRDFVLENLRIEQGAQAYLDLLSSASEGVATP